MSATADPTRPDSLALQGYQRLSQSDPEGAIEAIDAALGRLGEERPGLRARLWGWRCQALLDQREPQSAIRAIRQALRAAREAGDADGLKALRELQSQAMAQSAALKVPPPDNDESPLALAVRALDEGKEQLGEILALGALAHARREGTPREVVFACLALARVPRRTARAIADALAFADASGDMNLITAATRAAQAAGITIEPRVF
jgi:tetratricopeptide (TPR) repeat protein